MYLSVISDYSVFNFLDKKHFAKGDCFSYRGRADPLTGILEGIPVDGNFRESQTLMACVSPNAMKDKHVFYTVAKETNNAYSFMAFVELMVLYRFLRHNEVLVMDNAPIHTGGVATSVEDFLWNHEVDGEPLRILVLFLPTRAPELNPIELIFHILVRRMQSYHYRTTGPANETMVDRVCRIMDEMERTTIENCCTHCGYNV